MMVKKMQRSGVRLAAIFQFQAAVAAAIVAIGSTLAGPASAATSVLETGSSLLYPLFNLWVSDYAKSHPDVQITTQSTGSGTGISQAISGIAQIGASDAYLSDPQMKQDPGMLNIPLAISSQMVNYNVPGLNQEHLKFNGPVLAAIYNGSVTFWDDKQIADLNPGVKLPHNAIIPVHRTDGSGDTFIFSQYLAFSTPDWSKTLGYGTTISWPPVQGGVGAVGNSGMVDALKGTSYSIAYIGISFKQATDDAKMGEAALQNRAGNFVLPTDETVEAAVAATASSTPKDERISLIFASGAQSYPIINYEYAIVKGAQPSPEMAKTLKTLLDWAVLPTGGNAPDYLKAVGFVALPSAIAKLSEDQIAEMH
jgi:phosphate transport system substrate-binding protein